MVLKRAAGGEEWGLTGVMMVPATVGDGTIIFSATGLKVVVSRFDDVRIFSLSLIPVSFPTLVSGSCRRSLFPFSRPTGELYITFLAVFHSFDASR